MKFVWVEKYQSWKIGTECKVGKYDLFSYQDILIVSFIYLLG